MHLGIDIGGTFTDFVLMDDAGRLFTKKLLSSATDPFKVVRQGVRELCEDVARDAGAITSVVHGSTVVPNALIERKGARVMMITTRGFKDVVEIGREWRYDMYDLFLSTPPVLVERPLRRELGQRTAFDGSSLAEVDPIEVQALVDGIPDGVQAVAVCFINSYASPQAEEAVARQLRAARPDLPVSVSSTVSREAREFERFSTAIANAYVQPLVAPYLQELAAGLAGLGIEARPRIVLSNGGLTTFEDAAEFPIRMVESGPAAGVAAAGYLSKLIDSKEVLAFDMGGTTAKASFIEDGEPLVTRSFEVARSYRFKPGSGIPLNLTSVDLIEIGAGGGSIARVDGLQRLRVVPDSSGADPGPACYGRGGILPCITDADLVLGYIDPAAFLGGKMRLDLDLAQKVIASSIGAPLGLGLLESAWGIHHLVNEGMANAVRIHAAEHGKDVSKCVMIPFGGAGGIHGCHVAERLGINTIFSPMRGSVLSAFGMLTAAISFDFVRTRRQQLATLDWQATRALVESMQSEGHDALQAAGVPRAGHRFTLSCDAQFQGQGHSINFEIDFAWMSKCDSDAMLAEFRHRYTKLHGRLPPDSTVELLNWRLRAVGPSPKITLPPVGARTTPVQATGTRKAWFGKHGLTDMNCFPRAMLHPGDQIVGPAVVQETDTSFVVPPQWTAAVDAHLNLMIRRAR